MPLTPSILVAEIEKLPHVKLVLHSTSEDGILVITIFVDWFYKIFYGKYLARFIARNILTPNRPFGSTENYIEIEIL